MRNAAVLCLVLVGGCATTSPVAGGTCREEGLSAFVGRQASAEAGAEILRRSNAKTLRWIPLNSAVTLDFRVDRVNVKLDGRNAIAAVTCG